MPLWGVADSNAGEPKNLAEGEFQGTAGKAIFGVDNTEQGVVNGKMEMLVSMQHHTLDGLELNTYGYARKLRVKTETLVALNITSADQSDDTIFADS